MLRLLFCILVGAAIAVTLLLLRQQRLQLRHECGVLHAEIVQSQRVLWRQQMEVATATAPDALARAVEQHAARQAAEQDRPADASGAWHELPDALADGGDEWGAVDEW